MGSTADLASAKKVSDEARRGRISTLSNTFFFLFAGFAAVWLVVLAASDTENRRWLLVAYLVLLWATIAYVFLPRLYKLMTAVFTPDYFIGRSRTSEGILGDVINIGWNGDEEDLHRIMKAAGWTLSDPITFKSSVGIVRSVLLHTPYPAAPVSALFLFGRQQDFAYQMDVDGSAGQRHHIRFWKCPEDWPLPGGRTVDWLAAAAFDDGVRLSAFTLQVTHSISGNIDKERDFTISSARKVDRNLNVEWIEKFSTAFHTRNGGGDMIHTDGNLPIVAVTDLPDTVPQLDEAELQRLKNVNPPQPKTFSELFRQTLRPKSLYLALLIALATAFADVWGLVRGDSVAGWIHIVAMVLIVLGTLGLVLGREWSRTMLLLLYGVNVLLRFIGWIDHQFPVTTDNILYVSLAVLMLLVLSSDPITKYTETMTKWRREHRG